MLIGLLLRNFPQYMYIESLHVHGCIILLTFLIKMFCSVRRNPTHLLWKKLHSHDCYKSITRQCKSVFVSFLTLKYLLIDITYAIISAKVSQGRGGGMSVFSRSLGNFSFVPLLATKITQRSLVTAYVSSLFPTIFWLWALYFHWKVCLVPSLFPCSLETPVFETLIDSHKDYTVQMDFFKTKYLIQF